ncbi:MAG: cupredoxin domain-containing protein, partial [Gaiellaceae bacterium]
MKKLLVLLAGTLAIAGATPAVSQSEPTATVSVAILSTGFQPSSVVIRAGDTVTWRNADSQPHRVVSETNAFPASPLLQPGERYSFQFDTPSAYPYRDGVEGSK